MTQPGAQASSGLLLVDKPAGVTSHDVVAKLRKILGTRRVGHAGTLDPMATGLLVIGVNSGTKLLNYITGADKTYLATIRLGWATDTDDAEGNSLGRPSGGQEPLGISEQQIAEALASFFGEQQQVPSSVSAIRVAGKRAYDLVRSGVEVKLEARSVFISEIEQLGLPRRGPENEFVDIDIRVSCSSGTYIRAIARDLGEMLGTGGHLVALRRTQVGQFTIDSATSPEAPQLIPLARAAQTLMDWMRVSSLEMDALRLGRTLPREGRFVSGQSIAAVGPKDELVAVLEVMTQDLQPRWVVTEH